MVEGGSSKDFRHVKAMMYDTPEVMHQLLDVLAKSVIDYLNAQIKAGAQAVQIFDTWGGSLSDVAYKEFSLKYMQQIVSGLIREHEGHKIPGDSCSPKAVVSGWKIWPRPVPMRWASTGLPTSATPAPVLATKSRCRAIWTHPCCTPHRRPFRAEVKRILDSYGQGSWPRV